MNFLEVVYRTFLSALTLFLLAKAMGRKQIGELNTFDYIIGITIGSIAAEMATSLEDNFLEPLVAMIVYAFITVLISFTASIFLFSSFLLFSSSKKSLFNLIRSLKSSICGEE